jgi:uncharacterized membrane protein YhaH (DUF805 family)
MQAQFAWFFLSFRGRISRQEFWLGYFFVIVAMVVIIPLLKDLSPSLFRNAGRGAQPAEFMAGIVFGIAIIILGVAITVAMVLWPLLMLYVKRLHDHNMSGWWLIAFFAAFAAVEGSGLMRTDFMRTEHISFVLAGAIGLARGQRGDNRFGPDPIVPRTT